MTASRLQRFCRTFSTLLSSFPILGARPAGALLIRTPLDSLPQRTRRELRLGQLAASCRSRGFKTPITPSIWRRLDPRPLSPRGRARPGVEALPIPQSVQPLLLRNAAKQRRGGAWQEGQLVAREIPAS